MDGTSIMEDRQDKEMLSTKQRFLPVNLHDHACASTALLLSALRNTAGCVDPMLCLTFSKQTRLEGVSAIRNTLKELTDFDPADVSLSLCEFDSGKKKCEFYIYF